MPSLFEVVGEVFTVRLIMIDLHKREMILELVQDGQTLAETRESLELRPEGWEVGGRYSLRDLDGEAASRAREAARCAQQAAA